MANPEHVEIVRKGTEAIAAWRKENRDEQLDLRKADLRGADLRDADLYQADLSNAILAEAALWLANLANANLSGASLLMASLSDATLVNADLRNANLQYVDLTEADLTIANLNRAALTGAILKNTNLGATDLTGATIGHTTIGDVDLSEVLGLESAEHTYPSTIGVDTLFKSKGKIPEVFLHGCGVPDELIVQLPAIIGSMEPIQFYSCFISHSTKDEEFCRRLYSRMRDKKLRVWYSPEDIKGGDKFFDQIDRAIRVYDKLLLVLSDQSMASDWVETEIRLARKREKAEKRRILFPIRVVDFETIKAWQCFDADSGRDLAVEVREYFIPDFSNWKDHDQFEHAFARLMRDLRAEERMKAEG